jgi:hypothetical protein
MGNAVLTSRPVDKAGDFSASAQGKALMYNLETPKPGVSAPGSDLIVNLSRRSSTHA